MHLLTREPESMTDGISKTTIEFREIRRTISNRKDMPFCFFLFFSFLFSFFNLKRRYSTYDMHCIQTISDPSIWR